MKIYSWNILYENKQLDRAYEYIKKLEFDILALQEVPETFLPRLKELPYQVARATDLRRTDAKGITHLDSLVILSRFPIIKIEIIEFPVSWYPEPSLLRTRIEGVLLSWRHPYRERCALHIEIELPDGKHVQVFCVHLSLVFSTPKTRLSEFNFFMKRKTANVPTVVCGDFNILEMPHTTPFNWLSGGTLGDWLYRHRERLAFESAFEGEGLQNPLRGSITHNVALSQLDHVLVPRSAKVLSKCVSKEKAGSDHNPVMVEIEV